MAVTQSSRLGIYRWSSGSDSFTRSQLDDSHAQLEALAAGYVQGTSRPAAAAQYEGFIWHNTSTQALEYCDGSTWIGLNSYGSPAELIQDEPGGDGIATTVARSDHLHEMSGFGTPVDVSTSNQNGIAATVARSDHQHKLADLVISGGALQTDSVDTDNIVNGSITKIKLAGNSVGSAQIETNAVTGAELAPDSVTSAHIVNGTIVGEDLANGIITSAHVDSIDAAKISGTVSSSPDIDASQVVSGTLLTARIPNLSANKITSDVLSTSRIPNLAATKITSGTINIARIPNFNTNKITAGDLADARAPERIKTTFAGTERSSRIYVNTNGPSGGQAYDIWIEY